MVNRIFSNLPSPALIIACIALFGALGGGAYAAATGSIDSREIKNNTVRGKDIKNGSIRNPDFKNGTLRGQEAKRNGFGGGAIKESTLGKVPSAAAADTVGGSTAGQLDTRWATVNAAGQIEAQSGEITAVNCYQANSNCYLSFGEDVRNRGITATINASNTTVPTRLTGLIGATACGLATVNCAPPGTESNNVVVVAPREEGGDADTAPAGNRYRFTVTVTGS